MCHESPCRDLAGWMRGPEPFRHLSADASAEELAAVCDLRAHVGHHVVRDHVPARAHGSRGRCGAALCIGRRVGAGALWGAGSAVALHVGRPCGARPAGVLPVRGVVPLRVSRRAARGVRARRRRVLGVAARGGAGRPCVPRSARLASLRRWWIRRPRRCGADVLARVRRPPPAARMPFWVSRSLSVRCCFRRWEA